jgi:hypothetical protein
MLLPSSGSKFVGEDAITFYRQGTRKVANQIHNREEGDRIHCRPKGTVKRKM